MLYQLSYFRILSASGLFGTPKVATPQGTDYDCSLFTPPPRTTKEQSTWGELIF